MIETSRNMDATTTKVLKLDFIAECESLQTMKNDNSIVSITPAILSPIILPLLSPFGFEEHCSVAAALTILYGLATELLDGRLHEDALSQLNNGYREAFEKLKDGSDNQKFPSSFWSCWNYLKGLIVVAILPIDADKSDVLSLLHVKKGKIADIICEVSSFY